MFDAADLEVTDRPPGDDRPAAEARVAHMVWERNTDRVVVTMLVGSLPVTKKFHRNDLAETAMIPGTRVWIRYDPATFRWMT